MFLRWRRFSPYWFSKIAFLIAIFGFPLVYTVSVYNEHINAFFPFVSAFGVFSPEKYWFCIMIICYAILNTAGNWLWFIMAKSKISNITQSSIPQAINSTIRILMTISGLCLIGLSIYDMEEYNGSHYLMTVCHFGCHVLSISLGGCLMAKYFENSYWFCCVRFLIVLTMITGAIAFVYFNFIGLPLLDTYNIYRMEPTDGGYWEFIYCAMAEWVLVSGCVLFTAVIALETNKYGNTMVRTTTKDPLTVQLLKHV
ncbi:unnamed protein product [Heterobilharzia americana]|nr:unnamed protein product [Heterobilharzia americana]